MRRTPVTWLLIAINVAAFAVTSRLSHNQFDIEYLVRFGADAGIITLGGQWWRLVTSMFLHVGILHLASNMVCLVFLGRDAERALGSGVFLGGYLLSGMTGSVVSVAAHAQVVSAGASGAVFGVAGLLVPVLAKRFHESAWPDGPPARKVLEWVVKFCAYNLLYSLAPDVDAMAHFGGFAAGILLGFAVRTPVVTTASPRRLAATLVGALVLLSGGALGARALHRTTIAAFQADVGGPPDISVLPPLAPALPIVAPEDRTPDLERRLRASPASESAYVALGAAYGAAGRITDAIEVLRRGVHRMPGNVELLTALGSAELNTGDFNRAVVAFGRACDLAPGSADLRYNLATALFDRAQWESDRPAARDSTANDVRRLLALPTDTNVEMNNLRIAARQLMAGQGRR